MSNNYCNISFTIYPKEEERNDFISAITGDNAFDNDLDQYLDVTAQPLDDGGFLIFSDSPGELEILAKAIQEHVPSVLPFGFDWSYDCDKHRPGSFGGGWCVISADKIFWGSTNEEIEKKITELEAMTIGSQEPSQKLTLALRAALNGVNATHSDLDYIGKERPELAVPFLKRYGETTIYILKGALLNLQQAIEALPPAEESVE